MNVEENINYQMQIHGDLGDCAVDIGNCYEANESIHGNNYG